MRLSWAPLNVWLVLTLLGVLLKLSNWLVDSWVVALLPAWGPICVGCLWSLFGKRR